MPYDIKKEGNKYVVIKKSDGSKVAEHNSRKQAERQIYAILHNEGKA